MDEAMQCYFAEKNVARRSALLRELVFACPPEGKEFFEWHQNSCAYAASLPDV